MKFNAGRRAFLGGMAAAAVGTAAVAVGTAAPGSLQAAESKRKRNADSRRLGLSCAAYCFRDQLTGKDAANPMTLEQFISFCEANGCDGVELTSYYFTSPEKREYVTSLKRHAFRSGLAVTGMPIRTELCREAGPKRDAELAQARQWLERASLLGAPCVRIFAGGNPKGDIRQQRMWCLECVEALLPDAERAGVALAIENHGGIVSTAEQLLTLVRQVKSDWFGVNLDSGNYRSADPYRDFAETVPYAITVQVKTEVVPENGKRQPADIGRIIRMLREGGYSGYAALEYEAAEPAPVAVPRALAALRKAIDETA